MHVTDFCFAAYRITHVSIEQTELRPIGQYHPLELSSVIWNTECVSHYLHTGVLYGVWGKVLGDGVSYTIVNITDRKVIKTVGSVSAAENKIAILLR